MSKKYKQNQGKNNLLVYQVQNGMSIVDTEEYENLKKDNFDLKSQILYLSSNEQILREEIITRNKTIDELRKENEELKKRITFLECQVIIMKDENNTMKKDHIDLKKRFDNMMNKNLFDKYIIAIQDLNSLEHLESQFDQQTKIKLEQLRKNRISDCHYLDNNDDANLINDKRMILLDKIDTMPTEIQNMFDKKYPNLINKIKPYIVSIQTIPSQQTKEEWYEWWE